jgi:hypothetical protein
VLLVEDNLTLGHIVARNLVSPRRAGAVGADGGEDSFVIGHSRHHRLHELLLGSTMHRLLRLARDADVQVVADRDSA